MARLNFTRQGMPPIRAYTYYQAKPELAPLRELYVAFHAEEAIFHYFTYAWPSCPRKTA